MTLTLPATGRRQIRLDHVGLSLVTVAALAGCSQTDEPPQRPASTGASSTAEASALPSSTAPAVGATYRHVEELCPVLDLSALAESFGPVTNHRDEIREAGSNTSNLTCSATAGRIPDGIVVVIMATIGAPASGQLMYEGLRGVQEDTGPITDVSGLGAAAYTYSDELTGTHVVTYDNNLYLTITAAPLRPGAAMPRDLVNRLTTVADTALSGLRD
ncbi:hypothetical protein ACIBTZ_31865 [Micromonospora sp. NPDC049460]|uniref:hypothetical protein n=1 Tax=Micromonospora sp. NPDC049460 TaxID=3364272 RepID=UPI0037895726